MLGTFGRISQLIGCFAAIVVGCGTPRPATDAPCIKPTQTRLIVRWGTKVDSTVSHDWYEIDAKGLVWKSTLSQTADTVREELAAIDQNLYCSKIQNLHTALLKTQALHSPGTMARFVEYANPASNVYLRAVWNPDLQTFQSRDMRAQFDSLMTLVPEE